MPSVLFEMMSRTLIPTPQEVTPMGPTGRKIHLEFFEGLSHRFAAETTERPDTWEDAEVRAMYRIFACVGAIWTYPARAQLGALEVVSPAEAAVDLPFVEEAFNARGWAVEVLPDPDSQDGSLWRFLPIAT